VVGTEVGGGKLSVVDRGSGAKALGRASLHDKLKKYGLSTGENQSG